jgi:hypothetical protein
VFIDELIRDMNDPAWPVEVRSLGRTLKRWRDQIIAWHRAHFSNGPTEAVNYLGATSLKGRFSSESGRFELIEG